MRLSGPMRGELRRVAGHKGDMPDWVAWGPTAGLAIVEAKGCHDTKSPAAALARAANQANRAEIAINGAVAPFKRYAIATRWGFTLPKMTHPMLWVDDPEEDGTLTPEERIALEVGIARWHYATLLKPLGFGALAKALLDLTQEGFPSRRERAAEAARRALAESMPYRAERAEGGPDDALIGGFVSRGGPLITERLDFADQEVLRRHALMPTFVGIERRQIKLAIEGVSDSGETQDLAKAPPGTRDGDDGAGSWVIRIDEESTRIVPVEIDGQAS